VKKIGGESNNDDHLILIDEEQWRSHLSGKFWLPPHLDLCKNWVGRHNGSRAKFT
jgi:hypothetical protein